MTAAAPRTAAMEARMSAALARRLYLLDGLLARLSCPCRTCRECQSHQLRVEASALRLEHAALYDTPAHLPRQLAIWAERERRALVRSVAW